ncbi:MAG: hypothetical protein IJP07_01535 [Firmicutes bacterium]|nr:hypothetical protein [Bacillota bacterium]
MKKRLALLLILVCALGLLSCESNSQKERVLLEKGPWGSEAIWLDDNSQMYLICTKDSEALYGNVLAFLLVEGQWTSSQLNLYQGAPIVSFCTADGEKILEAKAKMNNENLYLYDFETDMESLAQQYTEVKLSKFPYQEQADKLPFEIK